MWLMLFRVRVLGSKFRNRLAGEDRSRGMQALRESYSLRSIKLLKFLTRQSSQTEQIISNLEQLGKPQHGPQVTLTPADRVAHLLPLPLVSVISAVRSVLSATDTLTRRSPALKASPSLGDARKRILNSLATLVHQARVASAPTLVSGSVEAGRESAQMMGQAEAVLDHVTVFLDECAKAGVRVQAKSPELGRNDAFANGGQSNGLNLGLRAARSGLDMRGSARRPTLTVTTSSRNGQQQSIFSPDSAFPGGQDDENDPFARSQTITSSKELVMLLSGLQDTLLSSVAALIGHVHAHTRSAHGASYAQLVDLTRSTIERVREMLLVIEGALATEPSILPSHAERSMLAGCRERLYEATTALATAARVATGPAREGEGEEEEKANLLATSHAVLRSGTDAINAVKVCVAQLGNKSFSLFINDISAPSTVNHNEPESQPQHSGSALLAPEGGNRAGRRGANTISMLGRKATSLSCLKERFDGDGQLGGVGEEEAEDEDEDANMTINGLGVDTNGRKGSYASSIATTSDTVTSIQSNTPSPASVTQNPPAATVAGTERSPSRAASGGSSVMARQDSSRTSESAASSRSALSRSSTNDTSPRSSVSTAPDSRKWSAEHPPPAMPAFSPMFSTRPASVGLQSSTVSTSSAPESAGPSDDKWYLKRDYEDKEITFNQNGHVTGGTLRCLVERATLHDTTIDPAFLGAFLLTFRLFVTPMTLFQTLVDRFEMQPPIRSDRPALTEAELKVWQDSKLTPVRLRIYNFFKTWVEANWNAEADSEVIEPLLGFCRGSIAGAMPSAAQRLVDTVQKRVVAAASPSPDPAQAQAQAPVATPARPRVLNRMISSDRLKAGKMVPATADPYTHPLPGGQTPPAPVLGKSILAALKSANLGSVIEIDALELARQLTIKESRVYLAIKPSELLGHSRKGKGNGAPNVSQMSALSTKLTGWVSETILHETDAKKRAGLVKYFIKLSQQCLALNNYNALMAIICALNSSTISRLKKTWDGLAPKYRTILEQLKRATEHSRNYSEYRSKLRNAVPPALPFVGLFLTDLTFSFEGNPAERPSPTDSGLRLINFDRYQKMAKIIQEQQRFQVAYNLVEVHEIQAYLDKALAGLKHDRNGDSLWRQSLLVEPRSDGSGEAPPASASGGHGFDILPWR